MDVRTVFLVDDDADDIDMFSQAILEIYPKVYIRSFKDGKDVVACLRECEERELPHLLVLDYSMPLLDGPGVLRELAEPRFEGIPKFILSTSSVERHKTDCLRLGAWGYFSKPSSFNDLKSIFAQMLER